MTTIRIAILRDGTVEVWDKDIGVTIALLDYREPEFPKVTYFEENVQLGPNGDY